MIGNVHQDDVFLDISAGLGNVAAQSSVPVLLLHKVTLSKEMSFTRHFRRVHLFKVHQ
ncbi:hypothetical protein GQ600_15984 [Phytophthora cactorum]|nr:hypothetical protein GQ600_15984 [Phytophthora cactorum]